MKSWKVSRRRLLGVVGLSAAGVVLGACQPQVVEKIVKETVEVEKVVKETIVVEGEVKEVTKVVEKVVTSAAVRKVSPPGSLPIVQDRITVKIMALGEKDYNINLFSKWLIEQTNINIEWLMAGGADAQQKLNLALASGDLPDVVASFRLPLADQQVLAEQGVIIPLDDLFEEYGFWSKQMFNDHPEIREQISLLDGKFYDLPNYAEVPHVQMRQKMWIYQPWLDKLGLEMPTTTEEFYQVLKAFKTQDPNGNGKADEVPLSGGSGWMGTLDSFLMQPFVFNDLVQSKSLMVDNGVIKASYAEPGWREGLKYLNKLYAEGLIDPQVFSNDGPQMTALGENPDVPILGACSAGYWGVFTQTAGPSGRWKEYKPVPPLEGPTGLRQIPWDPYQPLEPGCWFITKACENPEAAFRLGDYFYSFDATMNNVWGMRDLDWRLGEAGEIGIGGGPAMFAMIRPWAGDPDTFINMAPSYQPRAQRIGVLDDPNAPTEKWLYDWTQNVYGPYGVKDKFLPKLVFTVEQSRELSELTTVIRSFVEQSFAQFVSGALDPESGWDTYLKQLDDLGLKRFLAIYQTAYDAKYGG
jgi:putative aldouronate transport system substrate-binding protein